MAKKKWSRIFASISGEIRPEDIPPAPGVNLEAIKAGDDDPLEVVVEIPAGKSTRGWNYTPASLKRIVDHVNRDTLSGFLGHQKPDDVSNKFESPVTHWIGAKMEGTKAYFRGVVDAAASDLKRWIRAGRIKQVSIFGFPQLQTAAGETNVVDYRPLSIDWTPLDRSGMPTRIVAMGEMDDPEEGQGGNGMDLNALIAQILALIASGTAKLQDVLNALDPDGTKKASTNAELIGKLKTALGVSEDDQLLATAEKAASALADANKASQTELAASVVKEKVTGEMAQNLILRMLHPAEGATKEVIAGEVDTLLATDNIKDLISRLHVDGPTFAGGGNGASSANTKRVSI